MILSKCVERNEHWRRDDCSGTTAVVAAAVQDRRRKDEAIWRKRALKNIDGIGI